MRVQMTAVTGLLTRHQKVYVQKLSQTVINESSDPASSIDSDYNNHPATLDAFEKSLNKINRSKDKTDKRFINMHRVSEALKSGTTLGPRTLTKEDPVYCF